MNLAIMTTRNIFILVVILTSISTYSQLNKNTSLSDVAIFNETRKSYSLQKFEWAKKQVEKNLQNENLSKQAYVYQIKGDIEFALANYEDAKDAYTKAIQLSKPSSSIVKRSRIGLIRSKDHISRENDLQNLDEELNQSDKESEIAISFIEKVPVYPGCFKERPNKGRKNCMQKNIALLVSRKFNKGIAGHTGLSGAIEIETQFTINKEGKAESFKVDALNPLLEYEALNVLQQLPEFKPGYQRGEPVRVMYELPIIFDMQ
ncbi:energy transducer TonB [Nonlabens ponticola]|uniref:TonB C-terminal domain-containing protein n=1 Tax=Nonlabens ponticola TaxID=2496866 RepID=A0A3S9MYT2_9FLAO|nr:energy transducer TonB [Nonlabens ponticola]AZQ44309.1 hypothetical protein EJ995_08695 [Nonlabens ponticola]